MKVMYVASNPDGAKSLDIEREVNGLQERLDRSVGADRIEFRTYTHLPIGELTDKIRRFQPDVLHFAAHGENNAIALARADGGYAELDALDLAGLLGALAIKPKLVVINACSSDGMAKHLAAMGAADFVIGTDAAISNGAARDMAAALYERLADASSIADAFAVAATHLKLVGDGSVAVTLNSADLGDNGKNFRLVDPFRILACLPIVDDWLGAGLVKPERRFRPEQPGVLFGVAGAPAAGRQIVFFTDDETVQATKDISLEEARSWIVETQPVKGEMWMSSHFSYYGDMNWYAAVTTTDQRIVSAASTTAAALKRYYFDEQWQGVLPEPIASVIKQAINSLSMNNGSRRGNIPSRNNRP